jgi:heme oxygenase
MTSEPVTDRLKRTTCDAHARLEALPFARALADGSLPLASYVSYLRCMFIIHEIIEHQLPTNADERLGIVWNDSMCRLPELQLDLAYFASRRIDDISAACGAAKRLADQLFQRSAHRPLSMLGALYVLEGSLLGSIVLGSRVRSIFGLEPAQGCAYLSHEPVVIKQRWQAFRVRFNNLMLNDHECEAVEAAASEIYAGIEDVLAALYPIGKAMPGVNPAIDHRASASAGHSARPAPDHE